MALAIDSLPVLAAGAAVLVALGFGLSELRHRRLNVRRRELLRLATEKRQHNFKLSVDEAVQTIVRDTIKFSIAADMGAIRRLLDGHLSQQDVMLREALALVKAERVEARLDRQQIRELSKATQHALFTMSEGLAKLVDAVGQLTKLWEPGN